MKKLFLYVSLGLLFCNFSYAEFKTYKCVSFGYYFKDDGELQGFIHDKPEDSKYNVTLIVDDENEFIDKDGSRFTGKTTLVSKDFKREYLINRPSVGDNFEAIRYHFVTDKEINDRQGSLKKIFKKSKGDLYSISFLSFEQDSPDSDFYELTIIWTNRLWGAKNYYKADMDASADFYRCTK